MLATDDGDPLLAFWPIRLGRTAVFASDVKDRWASRLGALARVRPVLFGARARARAARRPALRLEIREGAVRAGLRPVTGHCRSA